MYYHSCETSVVALLMFDNSFGDATEDLLRAALVNRTSNLAILLIHRLVQSAAQKRLTELEITKYFDAAVHLLCWGYPDHSKTDIGHQITAWERREKANTHINHLVQLTKVNGKKPGNQQKYADLLLRCGW